MADNPHAPEPVDRKRWGAPGASHRNVEREPLTFHDPREGGPTDPRNSKVSGGGGERDLKSSHDDDPRSSKGHRDA